MQLASDTFRSNWRQRREAPRWNGKMCSGTAFSVCNSQSGDCCLKGTDLNVDYIINCQGPEESTICKERERERSNFGWKAWPSNAGVSKLRPAEGSALHPPPSHSMPNFGLGPIVWSSPAAVQFARTNLAAAQASDLLQRLLCSAQELYESPGPAQQLHGLWTNCAGCRVQPSSRASCQPCHARCGALEEERLEVSRSILYPLFSLWFGLLY